MAAPLHDGPLGEAQELQLMGRMIGSEWFTSRPPAVQRALRRHPPWRFYELVEDGAPVRVVGFIHLVGDGDNEVVRLDACVATLGGIVRSEAGIDADEVAHVERWDELHRLRIAACGDGADEFFLSPIGLLPAEGGPAQ